MKSSVTGKNLVAEIDREKFEAEIPRLRLATYPKSALEHLPGKEHFSENLVKHIFEGELNAKGDAVGYHYEGIEDTDGHVLPGTRTEGFRKRLRSTFFPREWSPWQVAHAIKEAYENRKLIVGNKYRGESQWFPVEFYLDAQEKIKTAYPIKENE